MKKFFIGLLTTVLLSSCNQQPENQMQGQKGKNNKVSEEQLAAIPNADLTVEQEEGLVYMLEEEKLARDVYLYFADKYAHKVFINISKSEQKHMDAIAMLVNKYNLNYSVSSTRGVFHNSVLQGLYNELIARGEGSLAAAMQVGRDIELIDISDLEREIQGAPEDFRLIYQNLLNASYNHLSAFERNLSNL
jgi:hypothetical protein